MSYAIIAEVHALDDALFEKVFKNEAPDRIASTVAACLLQATNTDCDKADEIRRIVADLCHDTEAGDDIIAIATQIQELRSRRQAEKQRGNPAGDTR